MTCSNSKCPKTCPSLQLPGVFAKGWVHSTTREVPGKGSEAKGRGRKPSGSSAGTGSSMRTRRDSLRTQGAQTQPGNSGVTVLTTHVLSDRLSIPVPLPCGSGLALCHHQPCSGLATSSRALPTSLPLAETSSYVAGISVAFLSHSFTEPSPCQTTLHQGGEDVIRN